MDCKLENKLKAEIKKLEESQDAASSTLLEQKKQTREHKGVINARLHGQITGSVA